MSITTDSIYHNGLMFKKYINKETIEKEMKRVAAEISNEYRDKKPLFIGILNGSFVFTSDLVRNVDFIECQTEFCKVSSYKGLEQTGNLKQLIGLKNDIKDRHVIIVEDIIESGVTMKGLFEFLSTKNPASVKLCSMFLKPECLKVQIKLDFLGMSIDPEFVVGYGLDYDEWGRNLPDLWHMQPEQQTEETVVQ